MCELDRALHNSVLKREAWKEKQYREEKERKDEEIRLGFGATQMCKEELKKVIDSDRRMYYRTLELNDKLYIHYKGWKEIRDLDEWTGLRALYAECNAFDRIQGLTNCRNLRSLFLSENCIKRIEGLDTCTELWSLNLSNNFIERIEGLSNLKKLNTLVIAKNKIGLGGTQDVVELRDTNINSLDIQDNRIWDPDILPEVLTHMESLRVLYLKGNPCGKKIPNYRKGITVYCRDLRYLDDRPVFPEDRRAAEAFNRGGIEEERAERRRIREESNAKHDQNMKAFQAMIDAARAEKREKEAMRLEDKYTDETDPVEDPERRMQRQVDQWREEHKDELRDDARDHAERCLKSEREARGETQTEPVVDDDLGNSATPAQGGPSAEAVDNRKLVYEDIWDDAAPSSQRQEQHPEPQQRAAFAPPPRRPAQTAPAVSDAEIGGDGGGSSGSTSGGVARRDDAAGGQGPAWYAKFAEVAGKAQGVPGRSGHSDGVAVVAAGPGRGEGGSEGGGGGGGGTDGGAGGAGGGAGAELDEMD